MPRRQALASPSTRMLDIPGYTIEREIGHGGMAVVYLAIQETLNRQVALKVIVPDSEIREEFIQRFFRERKIVGHLSHHKIVTVYDTGQHRNLFFLAMEYLPNGTLEDKIKEGISLQQTLSIIKTIADALHHAHQQGIVHRDVKPTNVLFRSDGTPVLTDFGVAKPLQGGVLTKIGTIVGTPLYMSPEQLEGKQIDQRSDLYSLGILFYEMLTGSPPFNSSSFYGICIQHKTEPIPKLPNELLWLQPILEKLLAKRPEDRFPTAESFINQLKKAESSLLGPTNIVRPGASSRFWHWGLLSGLLLAVVAASGYYFLAVQPNIITRQERIASGYWREASLLRLQKDLPQALDKLREGLEAVPGHPDLLTLQAEITADYKNRLLQKAKDAMSQDRLIDPADDNAIARLQELLQLDPEYREATQALDETIDRLLQQADELAGRERWQQAVDLLDRVLDKFPEQSSLMAKRQKLKAAADQRQHITVLLKKAETQELEGNLFLPRDVNAVETYLQVLAQEPGNTEARLGLERIIARFSADLRERREQEDPDTLLQKLAAAIKLLPNQPELLALQQTLQADKADQEVSLLLEKAKEFLASGKLVAPPEENATAYYRQVLERVPAHPEAQAGLSTITDVIAQSALRQYQNGAVDEALAMVTEGLHAFPEHSKLYALRETLHDEQRHRSRIQTLTEQVKRQLAAGQLFLPLNDNALATYQAIAQLDPEDVQARKGLHELAGFALQRARELHDAGDLVAALEVVEHGLRAIPGNDPLLELRDTLASETRRQDQIRSLLYAADKVQSSPSPDPSAWQQAEIAYRKILELEPTNPEAIEGLERFAEQYLKRAKTLQEASELKASLEMIESGLAVSPGNPDLLALRETVAAALNRQTRIADLLKTAGQQLTDGRLAQPAGDNAYVNFQKVLKLDPGNTAAQNGLTRVIDALIAQAKALIDQGDYEKGLDRIEQGLQLAPNHAGLLDLGGQIRQQHKENQIAALLSEAQRRIEQQFYSTPLEKSALHSYRAILAMDPDNTAARAGLQRLADIYLNRAKADIQNGNLEGSLTEVNRGLAVLPGDSNLLTLKSKVQSELEKRRTMEVPRRAIVDEPAKREPKPSREHAEPSEETVQVRPSAPIPKPETAIPLQPRPSPKPTPPPAPPQPDKEPPSSKKPPVFVPPW